MPPIALTSVLPAAVGRHAPALKALVPPTQRTRAYALLFRSLPPSGRAAIFARWFRVNAAYCRDLGSPLQAQLLELAAQDIEARGPCWKVVATYAAVPPAGTPLAFMAAVHRIVLEHPDCGLGRYYPSVGGELDPAGAAPDLRQIIEEHSERIVALMRRPVQTNEVSRSRLLVGGFLLAAHETRLPLRLLELGSSAGLNLRWDHYRYTVGDRSWGDPASPLHLQGGFDHGAPPLELTAEVVERRGCDLSPVDVRTQEGRMTLLCHVWPDQGERIQRLHAAMDVAAGVDVAIDQEDAEVWISRQLDTEAPGRATVVFDTGMIEYLTPQSRQAIHRRIARAGAQATAQAPVAWLHTTPASDADGGELVLTVWPGGERRVLARTDPHAQAIDWIAPDAPDAPTAGA
jgi:hypothetical protein